MGLLAARARKRVRREVRSRARMAGRKPTSATPAAPAAAPAPPTDAAQLEQWADLRDRGLITPEEYESKKHQLLGL